MTEADHELRRLPPPAEIQGLERVGIEIREDPISGAATGELAIIIIAALAGVSGGLLSAIGADAWKLLKSYFRKRYRQLEQDRQERVPNGGRFCVERIYIVSEICGVPVTYYVNSIGQIFSRSISIILKLGLTLESPPTSQT